MALRQAAPFGPAVGTAVSEQITPCGAARPERSPLPPPPGDPPVAVALSGGGFRATLSGLGVLRFLADAGLLERVRHSSSVSGGSVANGVFACRHRDLAAAGFTGPAFDELVLRPVLATVTGRSLSRGLLRGAWRLLGSTTRTDLLREAFDRHFFEGRLLEHLSSSCRFVFNAANLTTGVRFTFERDVVGDYVIGRVPTRGTGLSVAFAVAASAAVPGLLAPVELPRLSFPCQGPHAVRLVDGGVYDNMGLEPVDDLRDALLVALNAGGLFVVGQRGRIPLVRDLQLAQAALYRQSTALRRRWMVERFKAWEGADDGARPDWGRRGVLFGLGTTLRPAPAWTRANPRAPDPRRVSGVKTSFDKFPAELCEELVHAGWWLTGATLATYHPSLLDELPRYRPLP